MGEWLRRKTTANEHGIDIQPLRTSSGNNLRSKVNGDIDYPLASTKNLKKPTA
ncbi:protein of unknown function [Paenibacillus alvei]|uniref:Uncharacterized protein n=1 Tax=Paenibacillus alvei TaxID=44250 RepID=A0A383RL42_PAEAL|nr:protein of unknown function [Paenibacillus alvei]